MQQVVAMCLAWSGVKTKLSHTIVVPGTGGDKTMYMPYTTTALYNNSKNHTAKTLSSSKAPQQPSTNCPPPHYGHTSHGQGYRTGLSDSPATRAHLKKAPSSTLLLTTAVILQLD